MTMSKTDSISSTYPSLRNLEEQHQQVAQALRTGFISHNELFSWLQDLIVVTFGHVRTDLIQSAYNERVTRLCLMTGGDFRGVKFDDLEPLPPVAARQFRLRLEEHLNETFQKAYRDLRSQANEYVGAEERPRPAPTDEPVALRPSLDQLNTRQEKVLGQLLEGFEKPEEILTWTRRANAASYGELPTKVITRLHGKEAVLRANLLNNPDHEYALDNPERVRRKFAITYLFPAFNEGVRRLTGVAGEQTEVEEEADDSLVQELGA